MKELITCSKFRPLKNIVSTFYPNSNFSALISRVLLLLGIVAYALLPSLLPNFYNYPKCLSLQLNFANIDNHFQKLNINLFDPAVYSCELQYGGETAFVIHQSLCVESKFFTCSKNFCVKNWMFFQAVLC